MSRPCTTGALRGQGHERGRKEPLPFSSDCLDQKRRFDGPRGATRHENDPCARVAELVDAADSKSAAARLAGSSPASGTTSVVFQDRQNLQIPRAPLFAMRGVFGPEEKQGGNRPSVGDAKFFGQGPESGFFGFALFHFGKFVFQFPPIGVFFVVLVSCP